jgi:ABC-type phosphate transport system auxiliary subunit
VNKKNKD